MNTDIFVEGNFFQFCVEWLAVERTLPFLYHQQPISPARFYFPRQTYKDPASLANHCQIQLLHMHCQVYLEPDPNTRQGCYFGE